LDYEGSEPTLRDLFALIRRGLPLALAAAIVVSVATFFINRNTPPVYAATATVLASAQDPNQRDFGVTLVTAPPLDIATYQAAIRSRQVLADALLDLTGSVPSRVEVDVLGGSLALRAEEARTSSILRVTVRDEDPTRASDRANAVAAAAVRWDEQRATRSLETIVASLQAQIASIDAELAAASADVPVEGLTRNRAELQLQLSSARALRTAAVGRLELLEQAEPPRGAVSPRPTRNAATAGLMAALFAYGIVLLRELLNTRVRGPVDLAMLTGLPVLAEFPKVASGRRGLPMEVASYLRTAVSFAANAAHPKVILVTSTGTGHGKSSVAMALAESFSRQRFKTLLIDADMHKPVLAHEYALDPRKPLSLRDALSDEADAVFSVRLAAKEIELDLIPSFEPVADATELIANHMRSLLERVAPGYDVIVIDSPPILSVADALIMAPHTTGVVFAVSVPDADRRQVTNVMGLLRRVGVRVFGTVATNLPAGARLGAGAYGYGYGRGAYGGAAGGGRGRNDDKPKAPATVTTTE
jgi:capsular exopolysaccharide synthesis family protein